MTWSLRTVFPGIPSLLHPCRVNSREYQRISKYCYNAPHLVLISLLLWSIYPSDYHTSAICLQLGIYAIFSKSELCIIFIPKGLKGMVWIWWFNPLWYRGSFNKITHLKGINVNYNCCVGDFNFHLWYRADY